MPRYPGSLQRFEEQICARRQRAVQIEMENYSFPLFVYSYSSRGFSDLPERYLATRDLVPVQLISLYDLRYHLSCLDTLSDSESQHTVRFLDSGQYEVEGPTGSIEESLGQQQWSEELYVESAKSYAHAV